MTHETVLQIARHGARGAAFAAALTFAGLAQAAESFSFDKGHTEIIFAYSHLGNSTQHGSFGDYDGTIVIDEKDPTKSTVDVTIKAASIDSGVSALDDHLRSGDFFDVEKFPDIRFVSTAVKPIGKTQVEITGDLTIKDNTKPVVMVATLNFKGEHPLGPFVESYKGKHVAGMSATTRVLRSDFGVGAFAPLTGDLVDITIETELFRVDP